MFKSIQSRRGGTMRKPGDPGAPTDKALKESQSPLPKKCNCWDGYEKVPGKAPCAPGSCKESSPAKRTKPHTSWTQKDRDKYNRETGSNLKAPQPGGGSRRDSYCARSAGINKCKNPDKNGDCPNDIARRKWNC